MRKTTEHASYYYYYLYFYFVIAWIVPSVSLFFVPFSSSLSSFVAFTLFTQSCIRLDCFALLSVHCFAEFSLFWHSRQQRRAFPSQSLSCCDSWYSAIFIFFMIFSCCCWCYYYHYHACQQCNTFPNFVLDIVGVIITGWIFLYRKSYLSGFSLFCSISSTLLRAVLFPHISFSAWRKCLWIYIAEPW